MLGQAKHTAYKYLTKKYAQYNNSNLDFLLLQQFWFVRVSATIFLRKPSLDSPTCLTLRFIMRLNTCDLKQTNQEEVK